MSIGQKLKDSVINWLYSGGGLKPMGNMNVMQEYAVWYAGNEQQLAQFYTNTNFNEDYIKVKSNYMYRNTFDSERIMHSGVPRMMSDAVSKLIFGSGLDITVNDNENANKILQLILKDNKMVKQHNEGGSLESALGEMAYKISYDSDLSKYAIIETYRPTQYDAIYECGRLQQVIFNEIIIDGKREFKLCEVYGKGYIDYSLFIKRASKYEEVSLSTLERTKDLVRIDFDKNIIMAAVKTNQTLKGRSDYEGLLSEFDSLDEAWSNFAYECRLAKVDRYIPRNFLDGAQISARQAKNYIVVDTAIDSDQKIQYEQPNLRSTEWGNAINLHFNNILASFSLSPATFGINDAGANTSAASRRELEKASIRTRNERILLWDEFLTDFYQTVLIAQDIFTKKAYKEYDINVQFGDYIEDNITERVVLVKDMVMSGVLDTQAALNFLFGDSMTEEEKKRILDNLGESLDVIE